MHRSRYAAAIATLTMLTSIRVTLADDAADYAEGCESFTPPAQGDLVGLPESERKAREEARNRVAKLLVLAKEAKRAHKPALEVRNLYKAGLEEPEQRCNPLFLVPIVQIDLESKSLSATGALKKYQSIIHIDIHGKYTPEMGCLGLRKDPNVNADYWEMALDDARCAAEKLETQIALQRRERREELGDALMIAGLVTLGVGAASSAAGVLEVDPLTSNNLCKVTAARTLCIDQSTSDNFNRGRTFAWIGMGSMIASGALFLTGGALLSPFPFWEAKPRSATLVNSLALRTDGSALYLSGHFR